MSEDTNLEELVAQFKQLESSSTSSQGSGSGTSPFISMKPGSGDGQCAHLMKNYGIYLLFLVWTIVMVAALQPSYLFTKDETTQKSQFLWKRYFLVVMIVYMVLVGAYVGFQYYISTL